MKLSIGVLKDKIDEFGYTNQEKEGTQVNIIDP